MHESSTVRRDDPAPMTNRLPALTAHSAGSRPGGPPLSAAFHYV